MLQTLSELNFKGKWRSYQQRVLDELIYHLADDKLNIVAAPGAGKTTLGIEVLIRLKRPALILAPTITIKNQWKQRIIDNFFDEILQEDCISDDLEHLGIITISTYQNIHSHCKTLEEKEKLIQNLKNSGIETLVLDEAHHLRTEWYSTLNYLCKALKNKDFRVVSLTGTPPYDVSPTEWENYASLCGPVDAEISIPELVKVGDLCPHQDLIYFSDLTGDEKEVILAFNERCKQFFEYIKTQPEFLYMLESSPFVNDLENNIELIYQNTDFTIALVSCLLYLDPLHIQARYIAEFLELELEKFSNFSNSRAEILFNGILGCFKNYFKNIAPIKSKLKELNLINGNKVDFTGKIDFPKLQARSRNKLNAINEITKFEYNNIKDNLREVVLLDYIGKGDSKGLNILSVFEKLYPLNINLGILTGSIVIIPASAKESLYKILDEHGIDPTKVLTTEFKENYLRIETYGKIDIVSIVTELFEQGCINVIIGTAALLGEGWDSPCVNTLVIASTVGSFMLSNQMRGRALRINKAKLDKNSNIWHLVALDDLLYDSYDFKTVEKRFKTFEGISYNGTKKIQNVIERLGLDLKNENCESLNKKSFNQAKNRHNLKKHWEQVFEQSKITEAEMAPLIYDIIETNQSQNSVITCKIPKWCAFAQNLIEISSIYNTSKNKNILNKLVLKLASKIGWVDNNYKTIIDKNYEVFIEQTMLENFAKALLCTLCQLSFIKTDYKNIKIKADKKVGEDFYITLIGCTNYERNIFIKAFEELFKINNNYRYIIKQNGKYLGIPLIIGSKAKNVKVFIKFLEKDFGLFDVIFTKNPNGYRELLKAKYNIFKVSNIKNSRIWI